MNRPSDLSWRRSLCDALCRGSNLDDAVRLAVDLGASVADAHDCAASVAGSPLLEHTRELFVQLQCRDWWLRAYGSLSEIRQEPTTIDHLGSIEQPDFLLDYYSANRALFLPKIAADWPAVKSWTADLLKGRCGSATIEIMRDRNSVPGHRQFSDDQLRQQMSFAEYVDLLNSGLSGNDTYLVARNRLFDVPEMQTLISDFGTLKFVNTRSAASNIKMWFGPAGTVTPLHYDGRNNVMVQVFGTKRLRLYAPYYSEFMHQQMAWYAGTDPAESVEIERQAWPPAIELRLEPGDAIFIPVGWWHAVVSESISLSLNFHDFGVPNEYPFP